MSRVCFYRVNLKVSMFLFFFIMNSCAIHRTISKTDINEIKFGGGGGFTGVVKTYSIHSNGQFFEGDVNLKKIDKKKTIELFNQAKALKDYTFNQPGNMYSYIEIKSDEKINRIVWPYGSTDIDNKVTDFYRKLMTIIK